MLMENRNGLIVDAMVTRSRRHGRARCSYADGAPGAGRNVTRSREVWAVPDKAYDTRDFVKVLREMHVRPHVTQNLHRAGGSAVDARKRRGMRRLSGSARTGGLGLNVPSVG